MLDRSVVLMPENHRNYNDASKKHQTSLDIKRTVIKKPKWTYNKVINHDYFY